MFYIWSYFLTAYLVAPVQNLFFPTIVMSLLFIPHGVRVLTAWMFGWRSFLYLLPAALLCNLHLAGARAFAPEILAGSAASLIAAPLAFTLVRNVLGFDVVAVGSTRLQSIVAVGALASVLNLTALELTYGLDHREGVTIFLGDTSGLLLCLLTIRLALRAFSPKRILSR